MSVNRGALVLTGARSFGRAECVVSPGLVDDSEDSEDSDVFGVTREGVVVVAAGSEAGASVAGVAVPPSIPWWRPPGSVPSSPVREWQSAAACRAPRMRC